MENQEKEQSSIKLDNVNPEGIKKSGKVDRKGSSKFSFKTILIILVALASAVGAGAFIAEPYVTVPEIPYSIADTISANANETFLDEVLDLQSTKDGELTLLEKVQQIEAYLEMSCKLDDLKLTDYTDTVIDVEESDTFYKDLEDKYKEFVELSKNIDKEVLSEDALRLYTLAAELNGYKLVIDSKITTDGYTVLAKYGLLVAKTAVLDASGISYTNIENLIIPSRPENLTSKSLKSYTLNYTDPITSKVFTIKVPCTSIIHRVIENVYIAQSKTKDELTTEEIIADLSKYLNDAKVASFMRYSNDGTLGTINNYKDVRDIIEQPLTK